MENRILNALILLACVGALFVASTTLLRDEPEDLRGLYVHRCWDGWPEPGCKE